MADFQIDQKKLDEHVKDCQMCLKAKNIGECCMKGRILARILESKRTR
jgi:DNA transposition AAA+ family ATPase